MHSHHDVVAQFELLAFERSCEGSLVKEVDSAINTGCNLHNLPQVKDPEESHSFQSPAYVRPGLDASPGHLAIEIEPPLCGPTTDVWCSGNLSDGTMLLFAFNSPCTSTRSFIRW